MKNHTISTPDSSVETERSNGNDIYIDDSNDLEYTMKYEAEDIDDDEADYFEKEFVQRSGETDLGVLLSDAGSFLIMYGLVGES